VTSADLIREYGERRILYRHKDWNHADTRQVPFYASAEFREFGPGAPVWSVYNGMHVVAHCASRIEAIATLDGLVALEGF